MLTVLTAIGANAQITMVGTNTTSDTVTNAGTVYFTTPVNALNSATSGKYVVSLTETYTSGTSTARNYVLEGTVDGTNWFRMHGTRGTDGIVCDSISSTALTTGSRTWRWTVIPGMYKYLASTYPTPTTEASGAGRVVRLRVRCVGVTNPQSTRITNVKCLVQI